jgi:hypothetical protein
LGASQFQRGGECHELCTRLKKGGPSMVASEEVAFTSGKRNGVSTHHRHGSHVELVYCVMRVGCAAANHIKCVWNEWLKGEERNSVMRLELIGK